MMQNGMASPDLVEDDRKTNLIVNYLPQTMTQVVSNLSLDNYCTNHSVRVINFQLVSSLHFTSLL